MIIPEISKEETLIQQINLFQPKLSVCFIPQTMFGINLRSELSREFWNKLRRMSYKNSQYKCSICGKRPKKLECHEEWKFDDVEHIQELDKLMALCFRCHKAKHIAGCPKKYYEVVYRHMMKVNGWSAKHLQEYLELNIKLWDLRSNYYWKLKHFFGEV
jgi:hypothetical protein